MKSQKQFPVHMTQGKLANHPLIIRKLSILWGSCEIGTYFKELFTTDREHRNGFDPDVFSELARIYDEHNKQFPVSTSQTWGVTSQR